MRILFWHVGGGELYTEYKQRDISLLTTLYYVLLLLLHSISH